MDGKTDVVIVGGGIVGCASAYYLARKGVRVQLFEKDGIGERQSGLKGGWVRVQGRDAAEIPLMVGAKEIWANFLEETGEDVGWGARRQPRHCAGHRTPQSHRGVDEDGG